MPPKHATIFKVMKALANREWHHYKEIMKLTGLSNAVVFTCLKHLWKVDKIVDKKVDIDSTRYPYPVYWRLNPNSKIICPTCGLEISLKGG